MNLLARLTGRSVALPQQARSLVEIFPLWQSDTNEGAEPSTYLDHVKGGYQGNGVVFSVVLARLLLFSEASFVWRDRASREIFTTPGLSLLEAPWPNGTTGELLARMEQDVSLAGNAYVYRAEPGRLQRLRPDWVQIVTDGKDIGGYLYTPGGPMSGRGARLLLVEDVAHWSPIPDPMSTYKGMSWLTPVYREVLGDSLMTRHKGKYFENGATPQALIKVEAKLEPQDRAQLREELERRHMGADNAYKWMIVDGGADITALGHNFEQMAFAVTQAAGENRIAAAAGVPGIVVGLKEGLQAATYSNYAQAMRRFADLTMRPNWRSACGALGKLVPAPAGARLWYDTSDITALAQDEKDAAEIFRIRAETAALLIRVGYDPAEAGKVAETGEGLAALTHSGGIPVTLYDEGKDPALTNGKKE